MRISDWSSDVCSSDLIFSVIGELFLSRPRGGICTRLGLRSGALATLPPSQRENRLSQRVNLGLLPHAFSLVLAGTLPLGLVVRFGWFFTVTVRTFLASAFATRPRLVFTRRRGLFGFRTDRRTTSGLPGRAGTTDGLSFRIGTS